MQTCTELQVVVGTKAIHRLMSLVINFLFRYTKPKGQLPDYDAPVVLKNGQSTVEDFCNSLHKSIMKEFKQ